MREKMNRIKRDRHASGTQDFLLSAFFLPRRRLICKTDMKGIMKEDKKTHVLNYDIL